MENSANGRLVINKEVKVETETSPVSGLRKEFSDNLPLFGYTGKCLCSKPEHYCSICCKD